MAGEGELHATIVDDTPPQRKTVRGSIGEGATLDEAYRTECDVQESYPMQ
jgi:hypothetical protein